MRRNLSLMLMVGAVLAVVFAGRMSAAPKTYQFTGTVKTVEGSTFTVEKSANETWTFSMDASTKGTAKVGDKVTVHYTMVATEIESKPAAAKKEPTKGQ
ncbi:MAG: hypothetical protein ACM36C_04585 [Acidobacteriota bacterium]